MASQYDSVSTASPHPAHTVTTSGTHVDAASLVSSRDLPSLYLGRRHGGVHRDLAVLRSLVQSEDAIIARDCDNTYSVPFERSAHTGRKHTASASIGAHLLFHDAVVVDDSRVGWPWRERAAGGDLRDCEAVCGGQHAGEGDGGPHSAGGVVVGLYV